MIIIFPAQRITVGEEKETGMKKTFALALVMGAGILAISANGTLLSPEKAETLRALGASAVFVGRDATWADWAKEQTAGLGPDAIVDCIVLYCSARFLMGRKNICTYARNATSVPSDFPTTRCGVCRASRDASRSGRGSEWSSQCP